MWLLNIRSKLLFLLGICFCFTCSATSAEDATLEPVVRFSTTDTSGNGIHDTLREDSTLSNAGLPRNGRIAHIEFDLSSFEGDDITSAVLDFRVATNNSFHSNRPFNDHDRTFDVNLFVGNGMAELSDWNQDGNTRVDAVTYHSSASNSPFLVDLTTHAQSLIGNIDNDSYLGVSLVGLPTHDGGWGPSLFRGDGADNSPQLLLETGVLATKPSLDLDGDGQVNQVDIDQLCTAVASDASGVQFDLNENGTVDYTDVEFFLAEQSALPGDGDLNGQVVFSDFLKLSANFASPGTWSEGDFNCSGNTDFADFLLMSNNFNKFATLSAPVPEPSGQCLVWLALIGSLALRSRPTIFG